ncbi:hypothetical protein D3C80_2076850 [compost metagenome]
MCQGFAQHQGQHGRGQQDGQTFEGQGVEPPFLEGLVQGVEGLGHCALQASREGMACILIGRWDRVK